MTHVEKNYSGDPECTDCNCLVYIRSLSVDTKRTSKGKSTSLTGQENDESRPAFRRVRDHTPVVLVTAKRLARPPCVDSDSEVGVELDPGMGPANVRSSAGTPDSDSDPDHASESSQVLERGKAWILSTG